MKQMCSFSRWNNLLRLLGQCYYVNVDPTQYYPRQKSEYQQRLLRLTWNFYLMLAIANSNVLFSLSYKHAHIHWSCCLVVLMDCLMWLEVRSIRYCWYTRNGSISIEIARLFESDIRSALHNGPFEWIETNMVDENDVIFNRNVLSVLKRCFDRGFWIGYENYARFLMSFKNYL